MFEAGTLVIVDVEEEKENVRNLPCHEKEFVLSYLYCKHGNSYPQVFGETSYRKITNPLPICPALSAGQYGFGYRKSLAYARLFQGEFKSSKLAPT